MFNLGFIINPIAGVGGSVALKGSDDVSSHAVALGAEPKANIRAKTALSVLLPYQQEILVYTVNNQMGEQAAKSLGFNTELVYQTAHESTQASDTEQAVAALLAKQVDIILTPATPTPAFKLGEKASDPLAMYLSDVYTIAVNLAGLPGISIPAGFTHGLPIGLQLIGNYFDEARILNAAHRYQQVTAWHKQAPELGI